MPDAEVILFPAREVRRDWSAARDRVMAENRWAEAVHDAFMARWQPGVIPRQIYLAWIWHVECWRRDWPLCAPDNAPWAALWVTFLIRCPEARKGAKPEGGAG